MSQQLLQRLDDLIHFIDATLTQKLNNSNANNSPNSQQTTCLTIGTWNIHYWRDGNGDPNHDRVLNYIKQNTLDIFATQESDTKYKPQFATNTGLKYTSMNNIKRSGVVLFSKYEIIQQICSKSTKSNHRMQLDLIKLPHTFSNAIIGVINVHLSYNNEKRRISEYNEMLKMIEKYKHYPLILLGDFNAFNRNDYVKTEWNQICYIFECNNWGKPPYKLLSIVNEDNVFKDCLYILKNKMNKGIDVTVDMNDSRKNKTKKKWNRIKRKDCSKNTMEGELWKNVLIGKMGTCRFDTRIDYIFVNNSFLKLFDVVRYEHCDCLCSDHKLVKVDFKFKM
eukprot:479955_1